jgi:hypothetical protein
MFRSHRQNIGLLSHSQEDVVLNLTSASWLLILLSLLAANLPFFNERCFGILALRAFPVKPFWFRLLELISLYFVLGGLAFMLETATGNRFIQTWEFYAVTACLFLVIAFPGFVYRYLKK